jgi:hypothetical protein
MTKRCHLVGAVLLPVLHVLKVTLQDRAKFLAFGTPPRIFEFFCLFALRLLRKIKQRMPYISARVYLLTQLQANTFLSVNGGKMSDRTTRYSQTQSGTDLSNGSETFELSLFGSFAFTTRLKETNSAKYNCTEFELEIVQARAKLRR